MALAMTKRTHRRQGRPSSLIGLDPPIADQSDHHSLSTPCPAAITAKNRGRTMAKNGPACEIRGRRFSRIGRASGSHSRLCASTKHESPVSFHFLREEDKRRRVHSHQLQQARTGRFLWSRTTDYPQLLSFGEHQQIYGWYPMVRGGTQGYPSR